MKTRFGLFALFLSIFGSTGLTFAQERFHAAVGVGTFFAHQDTSSDTSYIRTAPELVGYGYVPLSRNLWLRPGLRVSYAWQQPEMTSAIKIKEYDLRFGAEAGLVWNWVVVPSFSLGAGTIFRHTVLEVAAPVTVPQDNISGDSYLPFIQGQFGIGIPIEKGLFVLEPYSRYTHVFSDSRLNWALGLEFTVSIQ